ncbi:hypothetical protein ATB97_11640 [Elizabethkingia bruuniana]|nr:hypothetical protein AYC65_12295 [Elizabethkingia bruuniana]KGO09695.1 hypothetical protein KS04_13365 [Elizabethkingia miricola]KUY22838.1 hypothetical protein ATB97_11640 [Elizabethkingia bruuniana]OPB68717.1 hypothetical protein BAY12_00790 [Elizabethkingia bruuniana]QDZ61911.1 HAMP domain-containing histidine kinase [Elizabethkingia bruuniana]
MVKKDISYKNGISMQIKIYADWKSLKIILKNILDNTIKYNLPKGNTSTNENILTDNYFSITIEDIGISRSKEPQKEISCKS